MNATALTLLGLWVAVIVALFECGRVLATNELRRKAVVVLSLCLLLACAATGGFYYWAYRTEREILAQLAKDPYEQLESSWASERHPEGRARASRAYAEAAFVATGRVLNHLDNSGEWIAFQPTAKDLADRESAVSVNAQLTGHAAAFLSVAVRWWLSAPLAFILGLALGLYRRQGQTA